VPHTSSSDSWPHVVVVGGGFGGLAAARALAKAPVRVTMLDRRNHHLFQPLLYQVATAALNPSDIASPIRAILRRQRNAQVLLSEVRAVDSATRRLVLEEGSLAYDYLILATGVTHSYFGNEAWSQHAPGLKTLGDALEMRRRILLAFEEAERSDDEAARRAHLTFVVVGAGPTGAELAGALGEIAHHAFAKDFRRIVTQSARILLVEAGERVLPTYPPELSQKAERSLAGLGVEVRTRARVTAIDAGGVTLQDGPSATSERILARTVLWAAGVSASPLAHTLGAPLDRAGRVLVEPDLSVPGHPEVFVVGDLAAVRHGDDWVPGVAPAALQEGAFAARVIREKLRGRAVEPFRYWDKGSLATLGRGSAVASFKRAKLSGLVAWLAWLLIHIFFLIGFRNRFIVLFQWAWSYVTYQRGARLIIGGTDTQRASKS
jgi:NADH dehydrogenase